MYRKLALKSSVWHKPDIEFEWDPDARQVRGRDAQLVLELLLDAVKAGEIVSHPWPTTYKIEQPLANAAEMFAVLGQCWVLTVEQTALLHVPPDEELPTLQDASGNRIPVQILH